MVDGTPEILPLAVRILDFTGEARKYRLPPCPASHAVNPPSPLEPFSQLLALTSPILFFHLPAFSLSRFLNLYVLCSPLSPSSPAALFHVASSFLYVSRLQYRYVVVGAYSLPARERTHYGENERPLLTVGTWVCIDIGTI